MAIGVLDALQCIYRMGKEMYPTQSLSSLRHRVVMFAAALAGISQIRNWYSISDNPWLSLALRHFPQMHRVIHVRYINIRWPLARRLSTIDQHYRMLCGPATVIARAILEEVELARFDAEYVGLRLVLNKADRWVGEGETALNLYVGTVRYYSVAFTLGTDAGQPLILVGAIQGSNVEGNKQVYRDMAHAFHGMRPRDLLVDIIKLLCKQFGISRIWAISNACRYKVHADYDQIWMDHGGKLLGNGFFEIPADFKRHQISGVVARKYRRYHRRYQMLEKLSACIVLACADEAINATTCQPHCATEMASVAGGRVAVLN